MTKEDIVAKIQKLLRLSKSDNPNEAALAASMAQELMVKYAIEEHEIEGSAVKNKEPIEVEQIGVKTRKIPMWQRELAHTLGEHFFCRTYYTPGVDIFVVGRRTDRAAHIATFNALKNDIEHMSDVYFARASTPMNGKTWKASFARGVVVTIYNRLKANKTKLLEAPAQPVTFTVELTGAAPTPSTAIILAQRLADVDAFMKAEIKLSTSAAKTRVSRDAFNEGKKAGHLLNLDPKAPPKSLKE